MKTDRTRRRLLACVGLLTSLASALDVPPRHAAVATSAAARCHLGRAHSTERRISAASTMVEVEVLPPASTAITCPTSSSTTTTTIARSPTHAALVGAAATAALGMVLVGGPAVSEAAAATGASAGSLPLNAILAKATAKALGGGKAGAAAAVVQVLSLMWLRTAMNYQYRFGSSLPAALKELYAQGGVPRFYRGVQFALLQGPLSRFGDTASNAFVLALLETAPVPIVLKTAAASGAAALFRVVILPVDTVKTTFQVCGPDASQILADRVKTSGPLTLWNGALASSAATFVGHYPWFLTYNALSSTITAPDPTDVLATLGYNAFLGLCASVVSDTSSNSLRVIKAYKQTVEEDVSYFDIVRRIVDEDGVGGLLGRGLQTRLLTNALQGMLFSVLWRYFQMVAQAPPGGS